MIFVTIGTQDKPFLRLLEAVRTLKNNGKIREEIVVQNGTTPFKDSTMTIIPFMDMNTFNDYLNRCDLLITHGGVGTIMNALRLNKTIIAVPRRVAYGEHENDHQLQIIDTFAKAKHLIGCMDPDGLEDAIHKAKDFKPLPWQSNRDQLLDDIAKELGL